MEETYIICLKKTNKGQKNIKEIIMRLKNQQLFYLYFLSLYKIEKRIGLQ